jgi:cell division septation protein DedD
MDQALKARLIGAVILVGLGVLVIPELLSGRKSAPAPPAATG